MPSSKAQPLKRVKGFWDLLQRPRSVPLVMGIVNVTPDSFYPASRTSSAREAADLVLLQVEEGADLVDIGGQSTRPGSEPVSVEEELRRVIPVFEAVAGRVQVPLSVDTDKARVAQEALAAGAVLVNDVSALRNDPSMVKVAQHAEAVILMHRAGASPKTMQDSPRYDDAVREVREFLSDRREAFRRSGGDTAKLLYDPGIGFGKNLDHNLSLLKNLDEFSDLGPVVLGASRKSFLGDLAPDGGPQNRLEGSLAVACWAAWRGVKILRVHDVRATRRVLETLRVILEAA